MRSLLYVDWCTTRSTLVRYLGICMVIVVPIVVIANEGGEAAPGVFASSLVSAMLLFYVMLNLFASDEQGAWEQMRLTLPVTARVVVRSRYVFIVLAGLAIALFGTLVGIVVNGVLSALAMLTVPLGFLEVFAGALGTAVGALAYLALILPYVFKVGIGKARITFSLPFIACMLINVGPVRDALLALLGWLEKTSDALGSPAPLIALAVIGAAALYGASMLVSERLYEMRDF